MNETIKQRRQNGRETMTERLKAAAAKKRIFFITACIIVMFFAAGVRSFAVEGWNVKSVEFIPSSYEVPVSRIMERDNDGIYALNLANRGSNSRFSQCFFGNGDKCIVTYDDGSTKMFTFSKVRGVSYAEFTAGDGEVICLEALLSDVAKELKQSSEVSVDELAAIIGENGVGIEYGEYREEGEEIVGNYVRTRVVLNVVDDSSHDHTTALRGRSETPAQCEATGMKQDCYYCQICGKYFADENAHTELNKDDLILKMLGHDWGEWKEVEPATSEKAGKAKRNCSRCPAWETKVIPPDVHRHDVGTEVHAKKAGCTESGIEAHYVCGGCGAWFLSPEDADAPDDRQVYESALRIPAYGHKAGQPDRENEKPASCSSTGGCRLVYRCKRCGKILDVKYETYPIDPDAHKWGEWTVTKAAGEKTPGEEMRTCQLCGKTETRAIPANGTDSKDKKKADAAGGSGPGKRAGVDTGDSSMIALWGGLLAAAAAGLAVTVILRRKNRK